MLRDLPLYRAIIDGYYQPAANQAAMQSALRKLIAQPADLAFWRTQAQLAAQRYSKDHLAKVWEDFYQLQAKER